MTRNEKWWSRFIAGLVVGGPAIALGLILLLVIAIAIIHP
jgi:hypothetical protein